MAMMESAPGPRTLVDGRAYLYFAGTGYLGLQNHPDVLRAAAEGATAYGMGSATTRAWFGTIPPVRRVERLAAQWYGLDDALYYASGFLGGFLLAALLREECDRVYCDELAHFSLLEAVRLMGRPAETFRHADPDDLARLLRTDPARGARPLVVTDGVFSVAGTIAPLAEYVALLQPCRGAAILVDDAHALGVLGAHGRGTLEHAGLWSSDVNSWHAGDAAGVRLFAVATLSKALGGFGGILPGSQALIDRLKATSPYFAGASGPPSPVAAGTAKALEIAASQPELRARLAANVARLRSGLRGLGLNVPDSPVPIVALSLGGAAKMQQMQRALADRGILVAYSKGYSGTLPEGCLRLAVFATHTPAMIDELLAALALL